MVIIGIDPGIATVGYGIISSQGNRLSALEYGAITTQAGQSLPERLSRIYCQARELVLRWKPDAMSIEELFFNTNAKTAISVGHGRGVLMLAAEQCGVPVFEYTPLQVKQAVVGYGRADKKQVMQMTRVILGLEQVPRPDDTADALAVAICHAHSAGSRLGSAFLGGRQCSTT